MAKSAQYRVSGLILPVYLPSLLFTAGEMALIPTIPAMAESMGAGIALAGIIAGLLMAGTVAGDLPAARLVHSLGERQSMIVAALVGAIGILTAASSSSLLQLAAGIFILGAAAAVFGLARHSYLTAVVPLSHRGRALSILGGIFRAGGMLGPLIGAAAISIWSLSAVFWVGVVLCALAALLLGLSPDDRLETAGEGKFTMFQTVRDNRKGLATLGVASALLAAARAARTVGLPLWALHIGLDPAQTSLVLGIAGAVDVALFYTSGQIIDRFGRRWVAIPTTAGLGLTMLLFVLATDANTFLALALLMSLANGLGSGIIMLIGADLAPPKKRSEFLAAFRLIVDLASAAAPITISAITAVSSLSLGLGTIGLAAIWGTALFYRHLPRPSQRNSA
ncbi:MFS transporter [Candidatus Rhodoluna planktonica]|uniref:MFS transporter n=1 Tax=Candidatus Rhodoluna planktonica TaxID=535712 RepID=UPI0013147562|nr:MFS transporter [Candidatus Rhodoluna planktonica]